MRYIYIITKDGKYFNSGKFYGKFIYAFRAMSYNEAGTHCEKFGLDINTCTVEQIKTSI